MNKDEKQAIKKFEDLLIKHFENKKIDTDDYLDYIESITILTLIDKQEKEIKELKQFKKEVNEIIKYADDTAEPTYWNIRKLIEKGEINK